MGPGDALGKWESWKWKRGSQGPEPPLNRLVNRTRRAEVLGATSMGSGVPQFQV